MLKNKHRKCNILLLVLLAYGLLSVVFFFIASPHMEWQKNHTEDAPQPTHIAGELVAGVPLSQTFDPHSEGLQGVRIMFGTYDRSNKGRLAARFTNNDTLLFETQIDVSRLKDNMYYTVKFPVTQPISGPVTLTLESVDGTPGNAVTVYLCPIAEGRQAASIANQPLDGAMAFTSLPMHRIPFARNYWLSCGAIAAAILLLGLYFSLSKKSAFAKRVTGTLSVFKTHRFLLSQLVGRDFKIKYRRSYLGILWSVLNPLLMMIVISAVFSYIFRFNIENFPVYLILGQTLFGVMSDATNSSMSSVIGSGQLIKKVYIPKFIFPLEKVAFAFVNFGVSFIAVLAVILVYRVPITWSVICLPLVLLYLFMFSLGIGLFLSALAVFFRDTLHLYGVLLTAWTYVTPLFYPIDALPEQMIAVIRFNPMYHFITYFRDIMMNGTFPTLTDNWLCFGMGIITLLLGGWFFTRRQDKFILHI